MTCFTHTGSGSLALTDPAETPELADCHFRDDVLMKGKWDPTRGATIKRYFIGQCLIRFPNIYRWWRTN